MKNSNEDQLNKQADYLNRTLTFTGYGDMHRAEIYNNLFDGNGKFSILHPDTIQKTPVVSSLNFEQAKSSDKGYTFFKNHEITAPGPDKELRTQSFPVFSAKQGTMLNPETQQAEQKWVNSTITKTEGFNAMAGRAIMKAFTKKEDGSGQVEAYQAYYMLNYQYKNLETNEIKSVKDTSPLDIIEGKAVLVKDDKPVGSIKLPDFGIENKLRQLPIVGLEDGTNLKDLFSSIHRGNLTHVLLKVGNEKLDRFLAADPVTQTVAEFDKDMVRLDLGRSVGRNVSLGEDKPSISERRPQGIEDKGNTEAAKMENNSPSSEKKNEMSKSVQKRGNRNRKSQGV